MSAHPEEQGDCHAGDFGKLLIYVPPGITPLKVSPKTT